MPHDRGKFWHTVFEKAGKGVQYCEQCAALEGKVARVFQSQADFEASEFYGGEDRVINDEFAEFASWAGKNNIGRSKANMWYCTPMHPHCGHEQVEFTPAHKAVEYSDWFSDLTDEQLRGAA